MTLYPLTFKPILKERVWGGRNLERLYHKPLPPKVSIGESWEISDRPGDVSVIANGPLAGKDLRWLMENHTTELLGAGYKKTDKFPLLIKILDAQEKLSLQVHPPADKAAQLGGEPKTEFWYVADAAPGAELFVGLKKGTTRAEFERKIKDGTVADCVQQIPVKKGDAMFLPSSRLHALGGGNVIFEIQQNSDTTSPRVRAGTTTSASTASRANFTSPNRSRDNQLQRLRAAPHRSEYSRKTKSLKKCANPVDDPLFRIDACQVKRGQRFHLRSDGLQIIALLKGRLEISYGETKLLLNAGEFALLPASLGRTSFTAETQVEFLHVQNR